MMKELPLVQYTRHLSNGEEATRFGFFHGIGADIVSDSTPDEGTQLIDHTVSAAIIEDMQDSSLELILPTFVKFIHSKVYKKPEQALVGEELTKALSRFGVLFRPDDAGRLLDPEINLQERDELIIKVIEYNYPVHPDGLGELITNKFTRRKDDE